MNKGSDDFVLHMDTEREGLASGYREGGIAKWIQRGRDWQVDTEREILASGMFGRGQTDER